MQEITSVEYLVGSAIGQKVPISEIVLQNQIVWTKMSREKLILEMDQNLKVMEEAIQNGVQNKELSVSGMSGGLAEKFMRSGNALCGSMLTDAIGFALAVSETNARMGRIVAAPTAGSCGILPGVLFSAAKANKIERQRLVLSFFNAAGIGMVVAKNASVSGAELGCQAECGSASAMAASALVELMGGTPEMCADACALAFKFVMGLVCDPVAGLVEAPCIKRNASGAANAFVAAQMALAGIKSVIPADEVIAAMKSVGMQMSCSLKETSLGGIAISPTAKRIEARLRKK